ncbi:MAG: class I SAM-dependent methyltransferase [Candidatus Izemoplasmatales bacterium]|nr:class I SAM-dependent methyltransferase [Candidatus Izemoplasmatales bacterium]
MMLYEEFAQHYDEIFPLDERTFSFLESHMLKGKTLDLGCGTGEYALALSRLGYDVLGIDIDQKMIDVALEKTKKLSLLARFLKGNCLDVVYKNQFQNVYCIGNTLVHLDGEIQMRQSLARIYDALKPGGTLILQIVNYDKILDEQITQLPTIKKPGISFERNYVFDGDKIRFETVLTIGKESIPATTILTPIRKKPLVDLLASVGFQDIKATDDFTEKPFKSKDSHRLVLTMKK